ncbi:MAG: sulfite exporter TauE/SafE family protein [Candidatus Dojkabacteria bacterium]|nr:sulfite exporter TauE/SafE family protein [Candidatus Dojkabacteria bacterium]
MTEKAIKRKFYVEGMHCSSCELLIEKKLAEIKGVKNARASTKKSEVQIELDNKNLDAGRLNSLFKEVGYKFSSMKLSVPKSVPLIKIQGNGTIDFNKKKLSDLLFIGGIVTFLISGFLLLNRSGISSLISVNSSSSLPAFFAFGLVAGASSCAALVGGIILSMSKQWMEIYSSSKSSFERLQPNTLFHIGRLISYVLLGALLGAVGEFLKVSITLSSIITIGVSVLMIMFALQMLGVKKLQGFQLRLPEGLSRKLVDERNFKGKYMPFFMGALTFFLPCGFTITAQGLALASGNVVQGGLIMFSFALGTLPFLFIIGLSSMKMIGKPAHASERFLKVAGILILIFAVFNINSQLNVLGMKSLNNIKLGKQIQAEDQQDLPPVVDGKQIIEMDAKSYEYTPTHFRVRVGIPVKWIIYDKGVSGCSNAIVASGLFEGELRIDSKKVEKEFTPQKEGTYKFSCWMGMISGSIDVVGVNQGNGEEFVSSTVETATIRT